MTSRSSDGLSLPTSDPGLRTSDSPLRSHLFPHPPGLLRFPASGPSVTGSSAPIPYFHQHTRMNLHFLLASPRDSGVSSRGSPGARTAGSTTPPPAASTPRADAAVACNPSRSMRDSGASCSSSACSRAAWMTFSREFALSTSSTAGRPVPSLPPPAIVGQGTGKSSSSHSAISLK